MDPWPAWARVAVAGLVAIWLAGCGSLSEPVWPGQQGSMRTLPNGLGKLESGYGPGAAAPVAPPSTLADYLRHAFANNPGLRAAFDRWQASQERLPQARSLDDPTLSFEYFIEQMDTRYRLSVSQMFPAFGVLRLRADRAAAEAQAAMHLFDAERFDLYARVVRAFHDYHYLFRATAVSAENHRLLSELEQAVESRYRSGGASFAEVIKIQVEREKLADRLATLRDWRRSQAAGLAALLNLPADVLLPWPQMEPSASVAVDEEVLADRLAELNPELQAAAAMVEAANHRRELARRSGWPRLMAGAGWMVMPGMDGEGDESDFSLMAGVTLPLWRGRYRAEGREAATLHQAAMHGQDNLRNRLRAELAEAVFKYREAERRRELFSDSLLPKAEQAMAVARQAYADGRNEFMTLIDAQRTLLEFQLLAERAAADREIALAEIGCCVGTEWPAWVEQMYRDKATQVEPGFRVQGSGWASAPETPSPANQAFRAADVLPLRNDVSPEP